VKTLLFLAALLTSPLTLATGAGIRFVYQPLTTARMEVDSVILVVRVPVITNISAPEGSYIGYISKPHRLPQDDWLSIEDSNILSRLGISVSDKLDEVEKRHEVTLDLSRMNPAKEYGVSDNEVVAAAVECIRRTADEIGGEKTWRIRIRCQEQDRAKWAPYETEFRPKPAK
jgi:hypothetical protein